MIARIHRFFGTFGWGEFATLAAVLVAAGGVFAFIEIVDFTLEGDSNRFDRAILLALRNPADPADPLGPPWVEIMFSELTVLGGYTVIIAIGLFAVGYLAILRKWGSVALVIFSIAGGALLNLVLKGTIARARPDIVTHLVDFQTASLPSGHAMLSAVAYLTIGALLAAAQPRRRLKAYVISCAVILTALVGISRVYLGVHWPTDVLAGWAIGASWAMACWLTARLIEGYRKGYSFTAPVIDDT